MGKIVLGTRCFYHYKPILILEKCFKQTSDHDFVDMILLSNIVAVAAPGVLA